MKAQTALVLGATGLIGSHLVKLLLKDDSYEKVIVLVRKDLNITHPKLLVEKTDFDNPADFKNKAGTGDSIFCCIGTTLIKVNGDKTAYRKIDFEIAVNAARLGLEAGYKNYLLVSSVGANATGNNFYLKPKGEVENAITALGYKSLHVFQPSVLLGKRKEVRPAEMLAKGVMEATSFLLFGSFAKYRAIHEHTVAKAMVAASKKQEPGKFVHTFSSIKELSATV